jgi:glutathione S-transferase
MPDIMGNLDKVLAGKEFIEGDAFSVSDVALGAYLLYIPKLAPQVCYLFVVAVGLVCH